MHFWTPRSRATHCLSWSISSRRGTRLSWSQKELRKAPRSSKQEQPPAVSRQWLCTLLFDMFTSSRKTAPAAGPLLTENGPKKKRQSSTREPEREQRHIPIPLFWWDIEGFCAAFLSKNVFVRDAGDLPLFRYCCHTKRTMTEYPGLNSRPWRPQNFVRPRHH